MAKNKNRKQGGPDQRGAQEQAQRGADQMESAADQPEATPNPAQLTSGGKRQKKFGHN